METVVIFVQYYKLLIYLFKQVLEKKIVILFCLLYGLIYNDTLFNTHINLYTISKATRLNTRERREFLFLICVSKSCTVLM
jgi:hypothetical protein